MVPANDGEVKEAIVYEWMIELGKMGKEAAYLKEAGVGWGENVVGAGAVCYHGEVE